MATNCLTPFKEKKRYSSANKKNIERGRMDFGILLKMKSQLINATEKNIHSYERFNAAIALLMKKNPNSWF
jgi:hypothetical protein